MILFLLLNVIVGSCAFLLNRRIFKSNSFADSAVSLFILYFAQIVSTLVLLGAFGRLYLHNILLLNSLLLLIFWIICKDMKASFDFSKPKEILTQLSADKIILFGSCVVLGFGLSKVFINLVNPPFGWDCLNYHFVFPVEWLKHGNLNNPITISDDPSPSYYPINGSLFFFWLMLPFKNVFLADLGQAPFFLVSFLAVYGISRKIGLEKRSSLLAATLFLATPNFFKQLSYAYVDVMVAALFLVCINSIFLLKEKFSCANVLLYSMSLGLLLGVKTLALPYSILLFIPFLYLLFKNVSKSYLFLVTILSVIILGGFTYIRNFLETGNPLYPLEFNIFGRTILRGVMENGVYRAHFKLEDYSLAKLLFHEGLGIQSTLFILPAMFLALPAVFIKRRKAPDFNLAYFLFLPVLIYLVYRYIIPLANTRYLYPLLGVGIVIAFYAFKIIGVAPVISNSLVVICILASMSELAKRQELIVSIILTLLLFFSLPNLIKPRKAVRGRFFMPALFICILCSLIVLEKYYVKNEYKRYVKMVKYSGFWPDAAKAWEWLNGNTQGSNIAYIGRPVAFPLYGESFKNNVYYVSVNKTEPAKLHYFKNSSYRWGYDFSSLHKNLEEEGNYRGSADYQAWLGNLLKRNTDYLFVYSLHQTKETVFPLEDKWARQNPEVFSLVFENDTIRIYKISK